MTKIVIQSALPIFLNCLQWQLGSLQSIGDIFVVSRLEFISQNSPNRVRFTLNWASIPWQTMSFRVLTYVRFLDILYLRPLRHSPTYDAPSAARRVRRLAHGNAVGKRILRFQSAGGAT